MSNEKNTKSISCLHHSILQMLPIAAIQYHSKDKNDKNEREKRKIKKTDISCPAKQKSEIPKR